MTLHATLPRSKSFAFQAGWIVDAPWAHPIWPQYVISVVDLTTKVPGIDDPVFYMPDATHEVQVWALDPDYPITEFKLLPKPTAIHRLTPGNHIYQFKVDDDAAAEARIQKIVDAIERKEISPDTDFTYQWDFLFRDGVTLKRSAFSPLVN